MATSAVFIMDIKGRIIISRDYRGDVPMSVCEKFSRHLNVEDEENLTPIITDGGHTFVYIRHNNIYLMAVTKANANCMVMLSFLYKLVDVFQAYFNELEEESIRDNFVITYELLDEMMDFGYPQSTEAKILQEFICVKEKHELKHKAPTALTNAVSWRPEGIVHPKNEIFLDVVESLNLLVASNGTVLRSEILGVVKMKSFLSGMPELKLGLNDKVLLESRGRSTRGRKAVDMEDVRFHQCVRLSRFENDRTISFVPPDGEFDLMHYRLATKVRPLIWIEAHVEHHSRSRVEYMIKAKSHYKRRSTANDVEIKIPVPSDAFAPKFKCSIGGVTYKPEINSIVWRIKQFSGEREYLMRAHFGLPSVQGEERTDVVAPISVKFELPYFTVSGIQVRYLKIIEKSGYNALPWVRYITQNGDYQIRMT
jgi:AP-1 complex subunit mu